ncbi:MAG: hypothetical protein ABW061_06995 [Polyangiaceae bacterium]
MKGLGWCLVLASFAPLACGDSGQTGSPSCSPPQACECAALADRVLVKATVLAEDGAQISLRIEEQLGPNAPDSSSQFANKTLKGTLVVPAPCSSAAGPFSAGDSVFASFYPGDQCPAYDACAVSCYAVPNSQRLDACLSECTKQCDPDTVFATPWLQPWSDTIAISPATTVTIADAIALSDRKTCDERYPAPPSPPCLDTERTGGDGCSLSRASEHSSKATSLLAALLGIGLWRRRRQRSSKQHS